MGIVVAIVVACSAVALAWVHLTGWWLPRFSMVPDKPYLWHVGRRRSGRVDWRIGIVVEPGIEFCLKRETAFDRLATRIGLAVEQQVGARRFDDAVYIVSDDTRVAQALADTPGLPECLVDLLGTGWAGHQVHRVRGHRGRLWFEGSSDRMKERVALDPLADRLLPSLHALHRALHRVADAVHRPVARRRGAMVVLAACSAGALYGGFLVLARGIDRIPVTIDRPALLASAFAVTAIATLAIGALMAVLVRGSSRAHLLLLDVVVLAAIGSGTLGYVGLRDYNMRSDTRPPVHIDAQLVQRLAENCGRRSVCYHATLDAGPHHPVGRLNLRIDPQTYQRLATSSRVTIELREGALGYRWIAALTPRQEAEAGPR